MKKYLFSFLFIILAVANLSALADDIYLIRNVKIENTSKDMVAGKQIAIDDGKEAAFDRLLKRFVSYGYIEKAPSFDFKQIDESIKNVYVIEEVIGETKYEARMNYEFEPEKILKILNLQSIGDLPKKEAYLLVPVLIEKGVTIPWAPSWFDVWKKIQIPSVTIPLGDLQDLQTLTSADLSKLNYTGLDVLARRYKVPVVVMLEANYDVPKNLLTVSIIRFENEPKKVDEYKYPGSFGIGAKELLTTAANDISNIIKAKGINRDGKDVKKLNADNEDEVQYSRDYQSGSNASQKTLSASVVTRSLADWSAQRRKLINTKLINKVDVNSFSSTQTEVTIYYIGEIAELQRSLSISGLNLLDNHGKYIIDRVQ